MGLPAREIHLCGDNSAVNLVKKICSSTGDRVHVHEYKRLSPLVLEEQSLVPHRNKKESDWVRRLRAGDCVVAFGRSKLFQLKALIEAETEHKCCVIYGALPPETRSKQAKEFNEGGKDILVTTDAVGMGLNLNIGRIIFYEVAKFDGVKSRMIAPPEMRQVGGRAGRFKSKFPIGHVTAIVQPDLNHLQQNWDVPHVTPLAGLIPESYHVEQFMNSTRNEHSLSIVMKIFEENSKMARAYFMCNADSFIATAKIIERFPMAVTDQYLFCQAPVNPEEPKIGHFMEQFARQYATSGSVPLPALTDMIYDVKYAVLADVEVAYQIVDLYVWLSYRLPGFSEREKAMELRHVMEQAIHSFISTALDDADPEAHQLRKHKREPLRPKTQYEKKPRKEIRLKKANKRR